MKTFLIKYEFNGNAHTRVIRAKTLEDAVDNVMLDCRGAKIISIK